MEEKYTNAFDSLYGKVVEYFKDLGYTKDHVAYGFENENEISYVLVPYRIGKAAFKRPV